MEKHGGLRPAFSLHEIFFGRLANFFRARSRKRRQFGHRRALASRQPMRLEPLEPRLLLSADASLVFVDSRLADAATLAASFDAEVILLDSEGDGVRRVAEVLSERAGVSAIHVLSHGVAGRVTLGSASLDAQSLELHAEALQTWGAALAEDGDIFFYGCSIADGDEGAALIDAVAALTGADVAASTDMTGAAAQGGDWALEYSSGAVDAAAVLQAPEYAHLLAPDLTGISAAPDSGSPRDALLAAANVRQAIVVSGTGFTAASQIVFLTIDQNGTASTLAVQVVQAAADGTSARVVVPDTARTGNISVVGGTGSQFLQIVPTLIDVDLTSTSFGAGSNFTVLGSGFTEGNVTIQFGATVVVDTGVATGADVFNSVSIGAGLDRANNDAISFSIPAGMATGPITVETAGGRSAALPITLSQVQGLALSGTPANGAQASANPGQTIRILGNGFDATTDVLFQTLNSAGAAGNVAVQPDFVNVAGTLMEVRVPTTAVTGNIQVVGAGGNFALQVVPTLTLARLNGAATQNLRLLGTGFIEGGVTVNVGAATVIVDAGTNVEVGAQFGEDNALAEVTALSAAFGEMVSVKTAGGTSAAVPIERDDTAGSIYDLAIFPPTAGGGDAGRLVLVDGTATLKVLNPGDLTQARTINVPGPVTSVLGVAFLQSAVTVGATVVPAGSLVVVNGTDTPDRLYYLNAAGAGTLLASVALGGVTPTDEAGGFALAHHAARGTLYVLRNGTDLVTEVDPATGRALRSFHVQISSHTQIAGLAVHPVRGTLLLSNGARVYEIDAASGEVLGNFDPIGNARLGSVDMRQQGVQFENGFGWLNALAFDAAGKLWGATWSDGRILDLVLPGQATAIKVGAVLAAAIDGVPADALAPSANAGQRILIEGSGFNRFTEVEFERVRHDGLSGYVRVTADAVRADGTALEVVVPYEAVTGEVRISGAPGTGLRLQVTPTIRAVLPADPGVNFDDPREQQSWSLFGSGLVEGAMTLSMGGVAIEDDTIGTLLNTVGGFAHANGRLDLTLPDRVLAGPVTVSTAGGSFTAASVPLRSEVGVGLTGITGVAAALLQGTPANAALAAANTGQSITLHGFGLTTSSLVVFRGVAEDGTRSEIVVRPTSVAGGGTSAVVVVPEFAVTGAVRVSGAAGSVELQVVPTLTGVSSGTLSPGTPLWLTGTGIPEGGAGTGEEVTYTIGGAPVTDTQGALGPEVRSALNNVLAVALNTPAGASGDTITVSTAGGSASLKLSALVTSVVNAEAQGAGAADAVGQTLGTAQPLALVSALGSSTVLTVNARLDAAPLTPDDVDLYRLDGARAGGLLSATTSGQLGSGRFRLFNEAGVQIAGPLASFDRLVLPAANEYYLGYSSSPNNNYNVLTGAGTVNGANPGDYTLTLRYGDVATTSLDSITAQADSGVPSEALVASANAGQSIQLHGAGFTTATRVMVSTFNSNASNPVLGERELAPTSVAADGTSMSVTLPWDAVTGVVRLADERAGLLVQIVPTVSDVDLGAGEPSYADTAGVTLFGSGLVEGAQTILLGSAIGAGSASEVQDLWEDSGPNAFTSSGRENAAVSFNLGIEPPTGPFKVRTLGGTSAQFELVFTGFAMGTVADRGTPANAALASANVREALTLEGAGFDMGTEVIFTTQGSNSLQRGTAVVTPVSVSADRTRMTVIVPDTAATGEVRVLGAEHGHFLQIVPTIVQVVTPAFATGDIATLQGSGFIEGEAIIGVGETAVWDTGVFFGPDVFNSTIPFAGMDRTDNDTINFAIPPGSANGPWFVTTSGGTARFGIVIDLGVVVQETRAGRTVAPGEQELFRATAAVEGWMDFDVTFTSNQADVVVKLADGTAAPLVEFSNAGGVVHARVAALNGQVFFLQTNGVGAVAAYDVVVTNQDRFDDPIGPAQGAFGGNYGADPDGRNDAVASATSFNPASHVNEPRLTLTPGESDWFTWTAQATGSFDIAALFASSAGPLAFNVYDDSGLIATSSAAADGARVNGLAASRGERFRIETFGTTAAAKAEYTFTFSNRDAVDAVAPGNDVLANAVDLGWDVAWSSLERWDMLTIHQPNDQDWFRLRAGVGGTLRILVDNEFPNLGHIAVNVRDANTLANLTQQFVDLGSRLEYTFAPVVAGQSLLVQFTGQPNSYSFSIQNEDRLEDNPSMGQPANRGAVVHDRVPGLSLPGLPDAGTRDDDWFRVVSPARDSRLDVTVTPSAQFAGDVTVRVWRDVDGDSVADAGEMLTEGTSVDGGTVTLQVPSGDNEALFVQVFDPASGPFTGVAYDIDFAHVDRFDRANTAGDANNTAATATNLGAVVGVVEDDLTLLPFDADWFTFTARADDGWVDVKVGAEGDAVIVEVYGDTNTDGTPDMLLRSGTGLDVRLEDIAAEQGQHFWIRTALLDAANPAAAGALVRVQVTNPDRFDDPVGDGASGLVHNPPTGNDPDGGNNGPRTTGTTVEGTLRLVQPDPDVPATFQGPIGVSTDGLGTFTTGNLQADIPAGSQVEMALLYVTTRSSIGPYRPSQIGFEGASVGLQVLPNVDNAVVDFETLRADVTSLVRARVGAAGGVFDFAVDETIANGGLSDEDADSAVEGTALVVIYSNPTLPVRSVAVLEGGLSGPATQTTRLLLSNPVNKSDPNFIAQLSLGIGFGFQPDGQFSTVNVNGTRMTSSAGNFDDGAAANGRLVTVGGVGDSPATPAAPQDTTNTSDDEFYDLSAFLTNGDREIVLETANPSDDDSIFLAVITVAGEASLGGILTDLGTVGEVTEEGLTLPSGDQDWYRIEAGEIGDMSATLDFASGSASALMYRDADDDNLPDDLNADGVPDSAGIISIEGNRLLISQIPARYVGDVFLLRVFDAVGQVEYDLDVRVNQHPEANPDSYTVAEDNTLTVAAPGVIANDTDGDSDPLTASLVSGVSHGALTFNSNGSFVYVPTPNYFGPDSFTYSISDGFGGTATATVSINVTAQNDAPVALDDVYEINEDTVLLVPAPGMLANDTDADGDVIRLNAIGGLLTHGTLTFANSDGSFQFVPHTHAHGTQTLSYFADDGVTVSNSAVITIHIRPVNDAPSAGDDTNATDENTAVAGNVLANDTDVDFDNLTVGAVNGEAANVGSTITLASGALLRVNADGTYSYDPNGAFAFVREDQSAIDQFTYSAVDAQGGISNTATVTVTVTGVNDAPSVAIDKMVDANRDSVWASSESVLEGGVGNQMAHYQFVLRNTSAASTDPVTVSALFDDRLGDLMDEFLAANSGSATISVGQSVTFMVLGAALPVQNAGSSHVNTVTVTAADDEGTQTQAADFATVTYADDAPAIVLEKMLDADRDGEFADSESVLEGGIGSQTVDYRFVVSNTSGASTDPLTLTELSDDKLGDLTTAFIAANGGLATLDVGQSVTFFVRDVVVPAQNVGSSHDNTVTVTAVDDENSTASAADSASVTYANVATPTIALDKTVDADGDGVFANFEFVFEGGFGDQTVDYQFVLSNTSAASTDPLTVTELSDDQLGDLMAAFLEANGGSATIGVGQSVTFFVRDFVVPAQNAGTAHINTATVTAADDEGSLAHADDLAIITYANLGPAIALDKTVDANGDGLFANSESLLEGGVGDQSVDYRFVVTNTSPASTDPLTIGTLSDNQLGDLMSAFIAANGGSATLGVGQSVIFFVRDVLLPMQNAGSSHDNTVAVTAADDEGSLALTHTVDSASVSYANVAPTIVLDKAVDADGDGVFASTESFAEGGVGDQSVDYRFVLTNTSAASTDPLTVTELFDDKLGDLLAAFRAANSFSATLGVGQSVTFFVLNAALPVQNAGGEHVNTVTVSAADDEGTQTQAADFATVIYADAAPAIVLEKMVDANGDGLFASSESVLEGAVGDQSVDYRFVVTNTSPASTDPLTVTSLSDDKLGNLMTAFMEANGGSATLGVGQLVTFFVRDVAVAAQNAGSSHDNTVTVTSIDDENSVASAAASASVSYANVATPTIVLDKAVDADGDGVFSASESLAEGGVGDQSVDYQFVLTNTSPASTDPLTVTELSDDKLGDLITAFIAANGGSAMIGVGQSVTFFVRDVALPAQNAGSSHDNTVAVTAVDDENSVASAADTASVSYANVATPTIVLDKAVDADGDGVFSASESLAEGGAGDQSVDYQFVLTNTSAASTDPLTVNELFDNRLGDLMAAFLAANGGSAAIDVGQSITFFVRDVLLPVQNAGSSHDNTVTVTAVDDENSVASAADSASVTYANVATPTIVLDKAVDADGDGVFSASESLAEGGVGDQSVDYRFVVSNTSAASTDPLTVIQLFDDQLGDLTGLFRAANGGSVTSLTLHAGQSVTFYLRDVLLPVHNAGSSHDNTVTVTALDDENSVASATDTASVSYANVATPALTLDKAVDADGDGVFANGEFVLEGGFGDQTVDYQFVLSNTSAASTDPLTVTELSDDKLGDLMSAFVAANGGSAMIGVGQSVTFFVHDFLLPVQNAGTSHVNTVAVRAADDEGSLTQAADFATVTYVNAPPVAVADTFITAEDTTLIVSAPGVLANDIDAGTLSAVLVATTAHGLLSFDAAGSFTYTPNANFNGTDSFTYRANDRSLDSGVATVTITVNAVNDAPVAMPDAYGVNEDGTLSVSGPGVLGNDTDVEGSTLSAALVSGTSNGSLSFNSDGSFTYNPAADFFGTDSFTYQANDGSLDSNIATVTIAVLAVNDAPVAGDDSAVTDEDQAVTIAVLANDRDVDNALAIESFSQAAHGTVTRNDDGTFTYTPDADFNGPDSFTYTLNDGEFSDTASVSITVRPLNDAPVAGDDEFTITEDETINLPAPGLLGNDTDVDGDVLQIDLSSSGNPTGGLSGLSADGGFLFLPQLQQLQLGQTFTTSFDYTVSDAQGGMDTGTVTIRVTGLNDAPLANDDSLSATQDTAVTYAAVQLLNNDTDVEGDALTIASVQSGTGGTAVLNADGTVTFTPDAGFTGEAQFSYVARDGSLDSNLATVTVQVSPRTGGAAIDIEKYVKVVASRGGTEGLTPGYWKQPHHFDEWHGVAPQQSYEAIFGVDAPGAPTMLEALGARGGGVNALLRHSAAALLNASHPNIDYAFTPDQIISMVQDAFASGAYEATKDRFEAENERGADLSGGGSGGSDTAGYGFDADEAPGLSAVIGETVQFTYVVTNTGTSVLSGVNVRDDNETPDVAGDDFTPTAVLDGEFNVGDADRDGLLDPGEAWIYTASTLVTAGQHVNVGTATGTLEGGSTVSDSDAAHWFGIDPATAELGAFVWQDRDADGIQDYGERGIEGVIVNLLDADATVIASTVTDARGFYHFAELAAGTYTVEIAAANFAAGGALAGWAASPADRGASDGGDSDGDPIMHRSAPIELGVGENDSSLDFGFRPGEPGTSDSEYWLADWEKCVNAPSSVHRGYEASGRKINWSGSFRGWWDAYKR